MGDSQIIRSIYFFYVCKTLALLTALAVSLPLLFFFFAAIPGFMLPTTGSDPDEHYEFGFWLFIEASIPFLFVAMWIAALSYIFNRWRRFLRAVVSLAFLGIVFISLAFAILHNFAGTGTLLFGPLPGKPIL